MLHFRGICGTFSSVILPSRGGLELDRERTLGLGVEHWAGLDSLSRRWGCGTGVDVGVTDRFALLPSGLGCLSTPV
jgi:hypothetical protein